MILFLYGPDTYRIAEKLKEIEQQYRRINGDALSSEKIDAQQTRFADFWDKLNQSSLFVKKKLLFLENAFNSQSFKDLFLKKIKDISQSAEIIVIAEKAKVKKTDKLFKGLLKYGQAQEFQLLDRQQLVRWLKKELTGLGAEIEPLALSRLAAAGPDLWKLSQLAKQLACCSKRITPETVDLFLKTESIAEIFKTIDQIAGNNKKRALQLLQNHLDKGDSPFYLLTMIAYQFRNLLLVKSGSSVKMHPFVLRKTTALAQRFSLERLKQIFGQICQTDLAIKTGRILPEDGLRTLLLGI